MSTVQEIFLRFYSQYKQNYTPSAQQAKAARDIMSCRSAALGGHVYECEEYRRITVQYNSCRNRHCPLCQGITKAIWIDQRRKDILSAPYFHLVFTIPHKLHPLIYQNQKLLYALMYRAVEETLSELSKDTQYLGAQIGFFSLLHTWGQDMHYHPHIHTVVLAGGLTKHNQWTQTSKKFFIPVKVLAKKFRGKFIYFLKQYYRQSQLEFYGDAVKYLQPKNFYHLLEQCYAKDWYTYTQRTFSGPLAVVKYLGRYTHRIAISNNRIVSMDEHTVTITVKDYKDKNKTKTIVMEGVEFIRRFLMHILPKGFVKIRHYGLLANRNKKTKLALCRKLTVSSVYKPQFESHSTIEILCLLVGRDVRMYPTCRIGKFQQTRTLLPGASP
ncbi:IS91 family transposase [Geosporobacter ferrireducens]|uniref:IS91 family transposase n=1 Tax=Geosporobacter ferrireducens TaxID=1424294 RepID=A0A1D8GI37_9FIRM|nr:IS91 family transposase [Geosporobacter ferrireducens]AOT70565.1 IS91 family transposase [Geosporobacter ferrireducens]